MHTAPFHELDDYAFGHLVLDLLRAEGMTATVPARPTDDILVNESIHSHENAAVNLRWRLYLAHQRRGDPTLSAEECQRILIEYDERRRSGEGLLLVSDSQPEAKAWVTLSRYIERNPETRLCLWNRRQLTARLERHPHLQYRYGLPLPQNDLNYGLAELSRLAPMRVLFISDQSALAHDLHQALRSLGLQVALCTVWTYSLASNLTVLHQTLEMGPFDLVICMTGDAYRRHLPLPLIDAMGECYRQGGGVLLFPFLALSLSQGRYASLSHIVPVRQIETTLFGPEQALERLSGPYQKGDYRHLIGLDRMAEAAYCEYDPDEAMDRFSRGIDEPFGLLHSHERLTLATGARLAWADAAGNPFIAIRESIAGRGRSCYVNTSCHRCLLPEELSSPARATRAFQKVLLNAIKWLAA